jgi:hypothetical protein
LNGGDKIKGMSERLDEYQLHIQPLLDFLAVGLNGMVDWAGDAEESRGSKTPVDVSDIESLAGPIMEHLGQLQED